MAKVKTQNKTKIQELELLHRPKHQNKKIKGQARSHPESEEIIEITTCALPKLTLLGSQNPLVTTKLSQNLENHLLLCTDDLQFSVHF